MNEDIFATDTPPVLDTFSTPSMWYRANGIAAGAKRQRNVADYIPQLTRGVPPQAIAEAEKADAQAKQDVEITQGLLDELGGIDSKQLKEMLKVGQAEGRVTEGRKAPTYQDPKMKGPGLVEMLITALGASGNPKFAPQILAAPFEAEVNAYGMRKADAQNKYERDTEAYNKQNALDMQLATLTANMDAKDAALVQRQAEAELKQKIEELKQQGLNDRNAASIAQKEMAVEVREAIAKMQDETRNKAIDVGAQSKADALEFKKQQAEALETNRKFYRDMADRQFTRATANDKLKWSDAAARLAISAGHLAEAKQRTALMGQALGISNYNAATSRFYADLKQFQAVKGVTNQKEVLKAILGPVWGDLLDEVKAFDPSLVPQVGGGPTATSPDPNMKGGFVPVHPKVPVGTQTLKQKPKVPPKPTAKPPPGFEISR